MYTVDSPRPIAIAATYLCSLGFMDVRLRNVMMDYQRALDADLPTGHSWTEEAFFNIFNDHYATDKSRLTEVGGRKQNLGMLTRTMEQVADDTLEIDYDEWIKSQSGFYPMTHRVERIAGGMELMGFDGASVLPGMSIAAGRLKSKLSMMTSKNHFAIEPSLLITVVGFFEQPHQRSSSTGIIDGLAEGTIDHGVNEFKSDDFKSRDWFVPIDVGLIPNPSQSGVDYDSTESGVQPPASLGDVGEENVLNYFLEGSYDAQKDWDPKVVTYSPVGLFDVLTDAAAIALGFASKSALITAYGATGLANKIAGKSGSYIAIPEGQEGEERFPMEVKLFGKSSILTSLGNF